MTEMSAEYQAQMYLGVEKLRALESHGLAVVDARRLEALEKVSKASIAWVKSRFTSHLWTKEQMNKHKEKRREFERHLIAKVNELEAIDKP